MTIPGTEACYTAESGHTVAISELVGWQFKVKPSKISGHETTVLL